MSEETVVVTQIEGPLKEAMMATLSRAIDRAEREEALALIIEINTPGGEVELMKRLGQEIETAQVDRIAYVTEQAVSAGAYIAMACDQIYTNEFAQIGSSYPIMITPFGIVPEGTIDPNIKEKGISELRSKFRGVAQKHQRPGLEALAEAMVDPEVEVVYVQRGAEQMPMHRQDYDDLVRAEGKQAAQILKTICKRDQILNLTAQEAFDYGFSDGVVISRAEVLEALGAPDARVITIKPSWSEKLVGALEHFQWLLLIAGLVLIYIEFKVPGFGLPGGLGILCLSLMLFRNYLVGLAEIPEILLVVLGLVLIAVELFVLPGFGVAGIAGITCVALGVLFSFLPFLVPEGPIETTLLKDTIRNLSLSLVVTLVGMYTMSRYILPKTPILGRMILDTGVAPATLEGSASSLNLEQEQRAETTIRGGQGGVSVSTLRPAGKVEIDGHLLDAVSEGDYIERSERIEVVRVESNHVVVRRVGDGSSQSGAAS